MDQNQTVQGGRDGRQTDPREKEFNQRLRAAVAGDEYETWFAPSKLRFDKNEAVFTVPNHFFENWIKDRYQPLVDQALSAAAGGSIPVRFEVDSSSGGIGFEEGYRPAQSPPLRRASFNPRYRFSTFVVGHCNELAHAACRAVAENPGLQYNPLFIFGGAGLGKTHLLNAAGNHIQDNHPELTVHYSTTEDFTNELIKAVRFEGIHTFKERYRKLDCLLLDDIQFLAGRERTQEELFHTFNTLFESGKQIIVTSDKMPREIPALEKRLRTRFEWGLLADLQPPESETKVAILQKKASEKGLSLSKKVSFFLASQPESNVRVLEGYLTRLAAVSHFKGEELTIDLVRRILGPMVGDNHISVEDVLRIVAASFGVKVSDLKGARKTREVSQPRQVAMYLCRRLTTSSFPEIGRLMGGKDHSTVVKGVKKIKAQLLKDPELAARVQTVEKTLRERGGELEPGWVDG